jgi:hypothetical protein
MSGPTESEQSQSGQTGQAGGGQAEACAIARAFFDMARLAQETESMLPGFDRQMRVAGDAAAAAQLAEAYNEYQAVSDALGRTWAQIEPTITAVLEAHPELAPPR